MSTSVPPAPRTGARRTILSFDVGIRHLAYCKFSYPAGSRVVTDAFRIETWDVIDLDRVRSVEECADRLASALHARFAEAPGADIVLIERQPKHRSIIMVAVQMLLCGYFSLCKVKKQGVGSVRFVSAKRKLDMRGYAAPAGAEAAIIDPRTSSLRRQAEEQRARYARNKRYAIDAARHYLEHHLQDFANLALLDACGKKDDLCDALLQGLVFVESS